MALNIAELVAALPAETEVDDTSAQEALQQFLSKLSHKPVPVSALARLWTLGTLQAKIAAAYLAYWIRSGYATKDENERRLNETHLAAAIKLLGGMGYLRGMIMKAGQLLATYPDIVPEQFVDTLGRLCFEAPPMHYSLLREHVRNELGDDPENIFESFETMAFAAASLGQVHRARLRSGQLVVVKIQYPNIAGTIRSDFRNWMALTMPMRLSKDWDNIRAQWDDVRQTVEAETDYEREASFLTRARAAFQDDEGIVVPRVYPEFSTRQILTMDYLDGVHLDQYLAGNPPQEARDRYGRSIMLASFRIAHKARLWYADSNPGNYLFLPDGSLGLVDFGCCREFTSDEWDYYVQVCKAYVPGGTGATGLREAMIRCAALDPNQPVDEEHIRFLEEYNHWWSDYLLYDGDFDFADNAFMKRGIDMMAETARKRYFRSMPVNIWIIRQLFGLRALCYRLRARVNMKRLYHDESWGLY